MESSSQTTFSQTRYDLTIVGGGIVGLAAAREFLRRYPDFKVAVLEKEPAIASHQTGHNSGVIHAGIYYKPGSLKARACVAGHRAMIEFCEERSIPYRRCGKLIVALDEGELPRLHDLYERGTVNGVEGLEMVGPERLREIEPYVRGVKGIYSPNTGVVDYNEVARAYANDIRRSGGDIITGCKVTGIESRADGTVVMTTKGDAQTRFVITCAGLYSDKISRMSQQDSDSRIIPFRGSYYRLSPEKAAQVRALIYPVPDPRFPFLGVHFTRLVSDEVLIGPNAVLAFAREGYNRWHIRPGELLEVLTYGGFWKLAGRYWKMGLLEMYRDYVKAAYLRVAQQYMPDLTMGDLLDGPSGVRAQMIDRSGSLVDDFVIARGANIIHVQNAPSPAATSSLVIAAMIADEAQKNFNLSAS